MAKSSEYKKVLSRTGRSFGHGSEASMVHYLVALLQRRQKHIGGISCGVFRNHAAIGRNPQGSANADRAICSISQWGVIRDHDAR
jgi:hypothetical protein